MVEVLATWGRQAGSVHVPVLDRPSQTTINFLGPDPLDNRAASRSSHLNQTLALSVCKQDDIVSVLRVLHSGTDARIFAES